MPKGLWIRIGNTAVPADERSLRFLQARKEGAPFIADTNGARNAKQLALWWCLCDLVAETDNVYDTQLKASNGLKRALHHVDTFLDRNGRLHIEPKSIAFESLTQEDFNALFQAALRVIADWLGSAPEDVQSRFDEMIADKRYDGYMR